MTIHRSSSSTNEIKVSSGEAGTGIDVENTADAATGVTNTSFHDSSSPAGWVDTDAYAIADMPTAFKYARIKTVTAGGSNDADYTIYSKKMW